MKISSLLCVLALTLQADGADEPSLVPGARQTYAIKGGESQSLRLTLAPGQYAQIELMQKGIDVAIGAAGSGMEAHEIDIVSANGGEPELLHVIAGNSEPVTITVRALSGHGRAIRSGEYELIATSLRQATGADNARVGAQLAFSRGKTLQATGKAARIREAIPLFERAAELSKSIDDKRFLAIALLDVASSRQSLRENAAALRIYEGLLPLLRDLGWNRNVGITHQTIGWIHEAYGEYQKALQYHQRALEILSSEPDSAAGHPTVLASIGVAWAALGDAGKALEHYERALKIYRDTNNKRGQSILLLDIAQVHASSGDHARALSMLEQALAAFREQSNARREAQTLAAIGRVHSARGDHAQAQPMFEKALESTRTTGDRRLEAVVLDELGELQLGQGRLDQSRELYAGALAIQRAIQDRRNAALSLYGLARVEKAAGNLPQARSLIGEALEIVETIRGGMQPRELRVSFRAATGDLYETQIEILMSLHEREPGAGWAVKALEASERARARVLTEALQRVTSEIQAAEPSVLDRQRVLRAELADREAARLHFLTAGGDAEAAAQTETAMATLSAELAQTESMIREASPHYAELVAPQPLTAAAIQRDLLDRHTALLEFTLGRKRSFVWAVTDGAITVHQLAPRGEIEKIARRAQSLLMERNRAVSGESIEGRRKRVGDADRKLRAVTRELYGLLVRPVQEEIGTRRLLIVPDGPLHLVPFGAMHDGTSSLAAQREIVVIPSAAALAALRRRPQRAQPAALIAVLADPVFRPDDARLQGARPAADLPEVSRVGADPLPRLRFSRREAELVSGMVEGGGKLIALDFDARRDFLRQAGDYRILHFATHALVDSDAPERSSLVLSLVDSKGRPVDGHVRLGEIFNLDLRSDLVVLSACDTAAGKEMRGEGLMSLTHGFLYAGARRVISTLWRVDDRATAELMKHFYRGIVRENLTPAAALRRAQQALARDKRWSAPYYWAAFVLQGEPR